MVVATAKKNDKKRCPECGSEKLIKWGMRWVKREGKRVRTQQFQCKNCGRISIKPIGGKDV